MEVHIRLYASSAYVGQHGLPTTVEELAGHRLITQSPASPQVRAGADFVQPFLAAAPASSLTVNNYFGILQGVIHGLGIGSLPDYLTGDFPDLVNVLPDGEERADPDLSRLRRGAAPLQARLRLPRLRPGGDQRLQAQGGAPAASKPPRAMQ